MGDTVPAPIPAAMTDADDPTQMTRRKMTGGALAGSVTLDRRRRLLARAVALLLALVVVPAIVAVGSVTDDQPLVEDEPAPRTIFADEPVRAVDTEATERARQSAAEAAEAVVVADREAQQAVVRDVQEVFASTRSVRAPTLADTAGDAPPTAPPRGEQQRQLADLHPELPETLVAELVGLSDGDLDHVERETVAIAQAIARQEITREVVETGLAELLLVEMALRPLPGDSAATIVTPLLELKVRPTVIVDLEATSAQRAAAAAAVPEVANSWQPGQAIVREGQIVGRLEYLAVEQLRLEGVSFVEALGTAALAMFVVTLIALVYLRRMQPRVWANERKLVLLGLLTAAYAALVVAASVLVEASSIGWAYVVPAGAFAMLTALLIHPVVGIATMLPAAIVALLIFPSSPAIGLFAAAAVLVTVPLTTRIAARSDLRDATLRAALSYPVLAAALVAVFGPSDQLVPALSAGAVNGLVTAIVVQGALPFLETIFRLPTVTALLDLNARDHPLLRELESKALGTYNHSVMVASLAERACRSVGADPLLGSVAALYHDIGKVRKPHFFIENQQGIANPHDELEPAVSAVVIQSHVADGVELAVEYRLPPEVVECIGSHHGTMLVSFFYDRAVRAAGGDRSAVDEQHFRYPGNKPRSKEAAILVIADCSEATTRAMAMSRGTLPREEIEATVDRLIAERLEDGQFDDSDLSFRDLHTVRDTIVASLVGIYHPRIAYPIRGAGEVGLELTGSHAADGQDGSSTHAPALSDPSGLPDAHGSSSAGSPGSDPATAPSGPRP
jgi:cyclic-di-AMP phosphodiesterase PgpH